MAILTPSRLAAITQETPNSESLATALQPWRRRLALQQMARWTTRGILTGLTLSSLLLLISRIVPWATAPYWAVGIGAASIIIAFIAAWWYRPTLASTAHTVDALLKLHDRLSTAWELRHESSILARLQRRDALKQLQNYTPTATISLRISRAALLFLGTVLLALVLLIILPNPMTAILKQQAAFQTKIAQQISKIDQIRHDLAQQATTPATQQQQKAIDKILSDLQQKLKQAKTEAEAQQAIAQAQAKLDQLRNPLAANRAAAQAAASAALQNSQNANLSAAGKALANNDTKGLSNALQKLSSQVNTLTPAQRSQLAQQIEKAANQASNNPNLSSSLHQLAKSIADGNASEVNDAVTAVQAAANQNAADQAQANAVNQASQQLQQSANSLTAATDSSSNQGQSQNQGQGQQGQGQGQGQGQQGQGQGQGQNGQGQGQGQGQNGQGQGGQGQNGQGGSNGAGNQTGKNEQVYVPGQIGTGTSTQSNGGDNGVVQSGDSTPYSQVIAQYDQMAHDAIDNSDVSPDMKDLVHSYFDNLEGK